MFDTINSEVTTNTNLAIAYTKDYTLFSPSIPSYGCSLQAVYTDATPAAIVFASTAVTVGVRASATITIVDYTLLAGKTVTVNGVAYVEGVTWTAATANSNTATSLAAAIGTGFAATATSAVVTVRSTSYTTAGNGATLTTDAAVGGLTLSAATLTGGANFYVTKTAHGLITGGVLQATTSSALPTGLSTSTDYYVIVLTADTFTLASSLANALLGTTKSVSAQGSGNDTLTSTALSGVVVKLQMSNDGTHWTDISGKTVTVSATGSVLWDLGAITYRYLRVSETPSTGVINLILNFNAVNLF